MPYKSHEKIQQWRRDNRDKMRASFRKWYAKNGKAYRLKNHEKMRSHEKVNDSLRYGKLSKQPCEVCATTKDVQAHHDDYTKPLEVHWLCRKHHRAHHDNKGDNKFFKNR